MERVEAIRNALGFPGWILDMVKLYSGTVYCYEGSRAKEEVKTQT
jgi:hypothetical protein